LSRAPEAKEDEMGRHRDGRRLAAVLGLTLGLLAAGVVPVGADTDLPGWGRTGPHSLRDREEQPGVTCRYGEPSSVLETLRVRPPRIRARNVTSARDKQRVSWMIRVQYWDVNEFWATASTAGPWTATAWDDQPAAFAAQTVAAPLGMGGEYRVVVVLRWWRNGKVEGLDRRLVDWYRYTIVNTSWEVGPDGSCVEHL
jgi:hypothetical protein